MKFSVRRSFNAISRRSLTHSKQSRLAVSIVFLIFLLALSNFHTTFLTSTRAEARSGPELGIEKITSFRIILVVEISVGKWANLHGWSSNKEVLGLIESLHKSNYGMDTVDLEIIIVQPSINNQEELSFYAALTEKLHLTRWLHGKISVRNSSIVGRFQQMIFAWEPLLGSSQRVAIFEARKTKNVAPTWYLDQRSMFSKFSYCAEIIAFGIETAGMKTPLIRDRDAGPDPYLWEGVYDYGVIVPFSAAKWRTFLRWFSAQASDWYLRPTTLGEPNSTEMFWSEFNSNLISSWGYWLTLFCRTYEVSILYPGEKKSTFIPGDNLPNLCPVRLLSRFSYNGSLILEKHSQIPFKYLQQLLHFASTNDGVVSLTLITDAYIEIAKNWICNVDVAGFRPPGLVWIVTDDVAFKEMRTISGTKTIHLSELQGGKNAPIFGTPGYWLLMLERTYLIRDLINYGCTVFLFETDQVWLRYPFSHMSHLSHGSSIDLIGALDGMSAIGGNLLYINPTITSRKLYFEICRRFEKIYRARKIFNKSENEYTLIQNDQTLLTNLVLYNSKFRSEFPVVFRLLDRELFVNGLWYRGSLSHYLTKRSQSPSLINVNYIKGVKVKVATMKKNNHFFLKDGQCIDQLVLSAIHDNNKRQLTRKKFFEGTNFSQYNQLVRTAELDSDVKFYH